MPIDYNSFFDMCSDALTSGKVWFAREVIHAFLNYPILAVPFIAAFLVNFKKAFVRLIETLI